MSAMQIELVEVDAECQPRIEGILKLQLGSVRDSLHSMHARISRLPATDGGPLNYRCELLGKLKDGSALQVVICSTGIHICVADAAANLSRRVKRRARSRRLIRRLEPVPLRQTTTKSRMAP